MVDTFVLAPVPQNPDEIAEVTISGVGVFSNWESVFVQHRWAEAFPIFRFTTADIVNLPDDWHELQFKPGQEALIKLGGIVAVSGVITTRQTSYTKTNKGVQFQGIGVTWYAARSSVIHETGNFDGKTWKQIADEVTAPTGIEVLPIGTLNPLPFVKCQCEPGETIWNFLERLARVRGIVLGSDHLGNMLAIDDHTAPVVATLQEGFNVISCQAVISIENIYSDYIIRGQTAASDVQNGAAASEQEADQAGTAKRYSPLLTPTEQPVWNIQELKDRAKNESIWHEGTIVQATVVVQGWKRTGSHMLWRTGDDVSCVLPMAMIGTPTRPMVMKIQTLTFTQDRNEGTRTALDLVAPWLLKDISLFNINVPGAPQAPDPNAVPEAAETEAPAPTEPATQ